MQFNSDTNNFLLSLDQNNLMSILKFLLYNRSNCVFTSQFVEKFLDLFVVSIQICVEFGKMLQFLDTILTFLSYLVAFHTYLSQIPHIFELHSTHIWVTFYSNFRNIWPTFHTYLATFDPQSRHSLATFVCLSHLLNFFFIQTFCKRIPDITFVPLPRPKQSQRQFCSLSLVCSKVANTNSYESFTPLSLLQILRKHVET